MSKSDLENKLKEFLLELKLDEKSSKTIKDYEHQLKTFINWIQDKEIDKFNLIAYKEYLLNSQYAIASKNKNIVVVNKFVRWLGFSKMYLKQFKHVQKLSLNNPLYPQEHKRLLRWAKKLDMYDMYLILEIFAHTGCRLAELKYFTVENTSKGIFEIYNKGKARNIILIPELKQELINYCKNQRIEKGYIFISPRKPSKMIHSSTVWRRLKKIAGFAKVNKDKIYPHAWRHLFAKEYAKLPGSSTEELADIFGHSKTETTRLYMRTSDREKQQRLEKMKYKGD